MPTEPSVSRADAGVPRLLVFSTLFPNRAQPGHGLFVRHRVRAVAEHCPTRVIAPVLSRFDRWSIEREVKIPSRDSCDGIDVEHPRYATAPGVARFADGWLIYLQSLAAARRAAAEFSFDAIDGHFAFPDGMAAALLARHFDVPFTVTVRGGDLDRLTRYRARRRLIRWTLGRAARVFAVSEHMARRAVHFGAAPERVRVIQNGLDVGVFSYVEQAQARRRLSLEAGEPLLLCVGHVIPEKGQHILIDALDRLRAHGKRPRLILIGHDDGAPSRYRRTLSQRIEQAGLGSRVTILPGRPQSELRDWYGAADVLVLPTFREGMPNVVREALACGTPVVASRVGGVPELLRSEEQGGLVEPGDATALASALATALERRWDRAEIARAGRGRTWSEVGALVAAEFQSLVRHGDAAVRAAAVTTTAAPTTP